MRIILIPKDVFQLFLIKLKSNIKSLLSQYIREAYVHKERKGHRQINWKLQETVSIL